MVYPRFVDELRAVLRSLLRTFETIDAACLDDGLLAEPQAGKRFVIVLFTRGSGQAKGALPAALARVLEDHFGIPFSVYLRFYEGDHRTLVAHRPLLFDRTAGQRGLH